MVEKKARKKRMIHRKLEREIEIDEQEEIRDLEVVCEFEKEKNIEARKR